MSSETLNGPRCLFILLLSNLIFSLAVVQLYGQSEPAAKPPGATPQDGRYLLQKDYDDLRRNAGGIKHEELPALEQKAANGDLSSQLLMGMLHQQGCGTVKDDIKTAIAWYHKAADQGSSIAENQIGVYYDAGSGHDRAQGMQWYRKAAGHGDAVAEHNLGAMLAESKDARKDHAEAAIWLRRSVEHGNDMSIEDLTVLYNDGTAMPDKSLAENRQTGLGLLQAWADQGNSTAQIYLALAYWKGLLGLPKRPAEAVRWMTRAAEKMPDAEAWLGWFRTQEIDVPTRNEEAVRWYRKAAEHGSALGQINLAGMYEVGRGVPKDLAEAAKWAQAAAEQGNGEARYHLAEMYESGRGVPKDKITSLMWFILARATGAPNFTKELHPGWQPGGFSFYRHPYKKDYEEAERRAHAWEEEHICR